MRPDLLTTPACTSPARRSTTPEPQMPMGSLPVMVTNSVGSPASSMVTRSMAPATAFIPLRIW